MRVSVKELLMNFSPLSDKALKEPLVIAKNGRDRLVLLSLEEYQLMRERHQARKPTGLALSKS
jgi:PHD/YefM family antitoxin component YafN of YafNO toxin-antitoxin module